MKVKARLTGEEFENLLRPRLMLFMSVDLEGSTAFKEAQRRTETPAPGRWKPISYENWLNPLLAFFREFSSDMEVERRKLAGKVDGKEPPEAPTLWKTFGDELIYVVELRHTSEADFHVRALIETLKVRNANQQFPLKAKGTAWLAGFPVGNALLPLENGSFDYLGASIDTGFRLTKFSTPRKMCISVELAWILLDSMRKNFEYCFDGRRELKGVMEKTGYPVICIDTARSALQDSEEALRSTRCDAEDLKRFCAEFIRECHGPKQFPFVYDESPSGSPDGYADARRHAGTFLWNLFYAPAEPPQPPGGRRSGKGNPGPAPKLTEELLERAAAEQQFASRKPARAAKGGTKREAAKGKPRPGCGNKSGRGGRK